MSSPDHRLGIGTDRVKMLSGRMFNPGRPLEAVINPQLAAAEHVGPGGTLRLLGVPNAPGTQHPDPAKAVALAFQVTGVGVFDDQVVPSGTATGSGQDQPTALLS